MCLDHIRNSLKLVFFRFPAARLIVGPLCERFGPRKVMAGLLFVGAIPTAMVGLVKTAGGLIALR